MSFSKVPFSMDSDAKALAQLDYEYLRPTDQKMTFNKFLNGNGAVLVIAANLTVLVVDDLIGDGASARIAAEIKANGFTKMVTKMAEQADAVRQCNTDQMWSWVREAVDDVHVGPCNVIKAMSFPKRFSYGFSNEVQKSAWEQFNAIQYDLRLYCDASLQRTLDGRENKKPGNPWSVETRRLRNCRRGAFYYRVANAAREYLTQLIGYGPEDTDDLAQLSPGVGLLDSFRTTKSPAVKLTLARTRDVDAPNLSVTFDRVQTEVIEELWEVKVSSPAECAQEQCWWVDPMKGLDSQNAMMYRVFSAMHPHDLHGVGWYDWDPAGNAQDQYVSHRYEKSHEQPVFVFDGERCDLSSYWCKATRVDCVARPSGLVVGTTKHVKTRKVRKYTCVEGHVVMFMDVPKSATARRGITIERPARMSAQLQVKQQLERSLNSTWVGRLWCNFHDQTQNVALARFGADTGELATTDITSASDWISVQIAHDFFPGGWYRAFLRTRATRFAVECLNETATRLYTLAPMGCGWTFIMETSFYWALGRVSYDIAESLGLNVHLTTYPPEFERLVQYAAWHASVVVKQRTPVALPEPLLGPPRPATISIRTRGGAPIILSVYGDDAIMPTEVARVYLGLCDFLGIQANTTKSFLDGPFRESCGGDWYKRDSGVANATPVYWPRSATTCILFNPDTCEYYLDEKKAGEPMTDWNNGDMTWTTQMSKIIDLQHRLWDSSPQACSYLREVIRHLVPDMTASAAGTECSDLWAEFDQPKLAYLDESGKVVTIRSDNDMKNVIYLTDPISQERVPVNLREQHMVPVTTYEDPYGVPMGTSMSEQDLDTNVNEGRYERALRFGGKYTIDNTSPEAQIPILEPTDERSLTHMPIVRWVLKI